MRRWTINGRFLTQPATGVQRYAREIVRALDAELEAALSRGDPLAPEVEIVAPPGAADLPGLAAIGFRRAGGYGGHAWEQTVLPRQAPGGLLCLCNTGPVAHRRQIICVHDMNPRLCPESYSLGFRSAYRLLLPALGRRARIIATVSEHSADEIARAGIRPRGEIRVMPNGHEHVARWAPARRASAIAGLGRDTIVLLGSAAPHKNIGLVLGLAAPLAAAGLRIAVVGGEDPRVFRRIGRGEAQNVAWLGRLGDAELAALLADCLCLAFPSRAEGFGLPPLEAMALGCPVVVSDRASLPEVCGAAALYAAPDDPEGWLRHFRALAAAPALREELAARGRARAERFRWSAAAEGYLRAMAEIDGLLPAEAAPGIAA